MNFSYGILFTIADNGSLKFLYTIFDKYLEHMLVNFYQNCINRTVQNFELFDKNDSPFLRKYWRLLVDVSVTEVFDAKLLIYRFLKTF